MTASAQSKAEQACAEYAMAADDVRRLTKEIGQHLVACAQRQDDAWMEGHNSSDTYEMYEHKSHLKDAYAGYTGPDDEWRYANHDDDVEGYLAEHCEHCLEAHKAIQARKEAMKRLGIAKRKVLIAGRALRS